MTEEQIEQPVEQPVQEPAQPQEELISQPSPSQDKVFISESELKALEAKVSKAPEDKKDVYAQAAEDIRNELEALRKEQAIQQEQKETKSELESLKAELNNLREQAAQPQRRGVSHTPASLFQKDDSGRTGIPKAELDKLTREIMFKKQ